MKALELSPRNWAAVDRGIIARSGFLTNEAIERDTDDGRIDAEGRVTLIGATECATRLRWQGLRLAARNRGT